MSDPRPRLLCAGDQAAALCATLLGGEFDVCPGQPGSADAGNPVAVAVLESDIADGRAARDLAALARHSADAVAVLLVNAASPDMRCDPIGVHRVIAAPWQAREVAAAVAQAFAIHRLLASERSLRTQLAQANAELDVKVQDLDAANELLEYWVEFSPAVLYSFSHEAGVLRTSYVGRNFVHLSGYERTVAIIEPDFWSGLVMPADRGAYRDRLAALTAGDATHAVLEYDIRHKAGNPVRVVDSLRAVHDAEGVTIEVVGAWLDVSARTSATPPA